MLADVATELSDYPCGEVVRVVDCRRLKVDRKNRANGHLGSHPWNLAAILASAQHRAWRVSQYLDLYTMLLDQKMILSDEDMSQSDEGDEHMVKSVLHFCEKGTHRSYSWTMFEGAILAEMGFNVLINPLCKGWHMKHCANPNRDSCDKCALTNPDVKAILYACVDEFYEVMCAAEPLLAVASHA